MSGADLDRDFRCGAVVDEDPHRAVLVGAWAGLIVKGLDGSFDLYPVLA